MAIQDWRRHKPIYDVNLSSEALLGSGELFSIGEAYFARGNFAARHWHETYEFGYFVSGHGVLVQGEQEYAYEPGQIYVISDLEPHVGYATDPCSHLFVVHFLPMLLETAWMGQVSGEAHVPFSPNFRDQTPLITLDSPVTQPVRVALMQIREEWARRDPGCEIIIGGLILQAIGYISRWMLKDTAPITESYQQREALKRIAPILNMIESRYAEPISLDEMAQAAFISRSHCCSLFRSALKTTPIAYRNARRLAEACRLLQNSGLPVHQVAVRVGFTSVQEFNRLFRREYGYTPTQFRSLFTPAHRNIRS